ncbi:MAG: TolC family protein [Bacteroidales bacterium]|jgi:outer membrane protein TolC
MKRIFIAAAFIATSVFTGSAVAQEVKRLTFDEVIKISEEQSPQALMAKHRYRASYWQFRSYQAQFRPTLILTGTIPAYSSGYDKIYNSVTNEYQYIPKNIITNTGTLSLAQAIGFSGTTISLQSSLLHQYDYEQNVGQFLTTPLSVVVNQPIRQYNTLRWQTKIEPLKYETAKKTFLSNIEAVHTSAVQSFFALALAQINKQIAVMNLSNADTLYRIAKGRYQLGTISEDELLQMQLSYLNAVTESKQADMNLRDREIRLRSFLGYNENVRIELIIPNEVPDLQVKTAEVLDLAMKNNPDILTQQLNVVTAQSNVAQARAAKGFNASLQASMGITASGVDLPTSLDNPSRSQSINIGFTMPILDWGRGKGNYRMAQSSLELTNVQVQQALTDFEQNLFLDVEQFNLQRDQVAIAAKSDTVAMRMFEVTKQRFMIGKIAILDLNNADTKKDQNRRAYVQALQDYWTYFYNIRTLALFDFINRKNLETDYERLLR